MAAVEREYWLHADDLFGTTSVTDSSGAVVERYEYHDYGFPLILDAAGEPAGVNALGLYASKVGNPRLFTGREWDGEAKVYHSRTRAYHPGLGRFMSVDRIGVWGDGGNFGNGFGYAGSGPLRAIDPYGLSFIEDAGGGIREIWEGFPNIFYSPPEEPAKPTAPNLVRPAPCPKGESVNDLYDLVRGPRDPADWRNPNSSPGDQESLDEWERDLGEFFRDGAAEWGVNAANMGGWLIPVPVGKILGALTAKGYTIIVSKAGMTILRKGDTVVEVATSGIKSAVKVGEAGENAVRAAFSIGEKVGVKMEGITRYPDGITKTVLSEVKNAAHLDFSSQLRAYAGHAQRNGLQFHLYVRSTTTFSAPLRAAIDSGEVVLRYIPGR